MAALLKTDFRSGNFQAYFNPIYILIVLFLRNCPSQGYNTSIYISCIIPEWIIYK